MTNHIHIITTEIKIKSTTIINEIKIKWETDYSHEEEIIIALFHKKIVDLKIKWGEWLVNQTLIIETESITRIEEIRIKITKETTIFITNIEIENKKIIATLTLSLQLELEIEIERITTYYHILFRDEEQRLNIIYINNVRDLELYYVVEIDGVNAHYIQIIVDLEAEWNLTISIQIEAITKHSHEVIIKFQLEMDIEIQVKVDQIRAQTILIINGLEEEARIKIEIVRQTVTVHIETETTNLWIWADSRV
jgi:hypothetical protein